MAANAVEIQVIVEWIRLLNVYEIKLLKTTSCIYTLDDHDQIANGKDKEDDCTEENGCERRRDTGDCSCKDFVEPLYGFGNCEKEVPWVGRKVCFVNLPTTCEDAGVCPHYPDMKYSFNACD